MVDQDHLVCGRLALSAASIVAFDLCPRPSAEVEVVRPSDGDTPAPAFGRVESTQPDYAAATTVVDNTPATLSAAPLTRLTDMLRLRRRRGRCNLAETGMALDRGPGAMALRDLWTDRPSACSNQSNSLLSSQLAGLMLS